MPCYNMERFVADTIRSVIHQTFADWELLIVDDASTDGTAVLVQHLGEQDDRIYFSANLKHAGIAPTRNRCLQLSKGRFWLFSMPTISGIPKSWSNNCGSCWNAM